MSGPSGSGQPGPPPGMMPPPPPGDSGPPPPPPEGPDFGPGTYEDLHKKTKEVFPINFEGGKFMVNKGLSNVFQVSHTVSLIPQSHSYRFGATYVGSKQISAQETYPVLLGDSDLAGNLTATMIHAWTDRTRSKFQTQLQKGELAGAQLTTEYRGRLHSVALTLANPDLVREQGIAVVQYLRKVTPRLDLGAEMVYQRSRQIPGGQFSNLSYAVRYSGDKWVASVAGGKSSLHACYYHRQSEHLEMGLEWESNFRAQESTAQIAYHAQIPKADMTFKASVDTEWNVAGVLEKRLAPMPFTLAISGLLNHPKNASKFGIGLIIGS